MLSSPFCFRIRLLIFPLSLQKFAANYLSSILTAFFLGGGGILFSTNVFFKHPRTHTLRNPYTLGYLIRPHIITSPPSTQHHPRYQPWKSTTMVKFRYLLGLALASGSVSAAAIATRADPTPTRTPRPCGPIAHESTPAPESTIAHKSTPAPEPTITPAPAEKIVAAIHRMPGGFEMPKAWMGPVFNRLWPICTLLRGASSQAFVCTSRAYPSPDRAKLRTGPAPEGPEREELLAGVEKLFKDRPANFKIVPGTPCALLSVDSGSAAIVCPLSPYDPAEEEEEKHPVELEEECDTPLSWLPLIGDAIDYLFCP